MKQFLSVVFNAFKPLSSTPEASFVERFQAQNIKLVLNEQPLITAKATRINKLNREVNVFNYRFHSLERRTEYLTKEIELLEKYAAQKLEKAKLKKEVRSNFQNPFKVGDIFVDSWGYDQTNVDSYQVVEVKPKSVLIKSICNEIIEATSHDSANVKPCKDAFKNPDAKPEIKPVLFRFDSKNNPYYFIKSQYGWMRLHEEGDTYHKSWGH